MRRRAESADRRAWAGWSAAAAAVAAVVLLGGCEGLIVFFRPDPKEKPKFELTRAPLLVLVEQAPGTAPQPEIRYHLARKLNTELGKNEVNSQVIPETDVQRVRRTHPQSGGWSEAELGRFMNAEQVLYVELDPYVMPRDAIDPTARSKISAHVRVVDAEKGDQLWPLERAGYEAAFEMTIAEVHKSQGDTELKETLATGLADRIAKLFYKHTISETEAFRRGVDEGTLR